MATNLVPGSATLPGLLPDVEADTLIEKFAAEIEGMGPRATLPALPTAAERRALEDRRRMIANEIRPLSAVQADKSRAGSALNAMFGGYPSLRNAAAVPMIDTYLIAMDDLPAFAVVAACEDIGKRRVFDLDPRTGRMVPIDPDYPPTAPRMYDIAMKHAQRLRTLHHSASKVLDVRLTHRVDPAVREAVAGKMASLAESLGRGFRDEKERALRERKIRNEKLGRDAVAVSQRQIIADYAARAREPVRAGNMLVSSELADQIYRTTGKRPKRARKGG